VRHASARPAVGQAAALQITSPADGSTYLIDPTLRREFQTLSLKAVHVGRGALAWTVDGRSLGNASDGQSLEWPLTPGKHRIEVRDAKGDTAAATITVR
jgi:penicillin-binding protein 1C